MPTCCAGRRQLGKALRYDAPVISFAAMHLDHNHINGMCRSLVKAGANLNWIYDPQPERVAALQRLFPNAKAARSADEVLDDPAVKLIAAAAITDQRGPFGCTVMRRGKDYFTDKAPFSCLEHLAEARQVQRETGRIYACYYSERIANEAAVRAGELINAGAIGRVIHVLGTGPHRLRQGERPPWFYDRTRSGGILCDIGSHQAEQFLYFTGARDAEVGYSAVGNLGHREYPGFEDFGEASLIADNGAVGHFRVDWFTPEGLSTWGDGRTFVTGTAGYIELRKYVDVARDRTGNQLYLVDGRGEQHVPCEGKVGHPYFGALIRDILDRTQTAMPQAHTFKAAEVSLTAQARARQLQPLT